MAFNDVLDYFDISNTEQDKEPLKSNLKTPRVKPLYIEPIVEKKEEVDIFYSNIYINQQNNIKKSERLKAKITKNINKGINLDIILKDSIECIGLMTGDLVFINQNLKLLDDLFF